MQITVETLSTVKKKINIEIPADRVEREIEKAFGNIAKKAAVKGFRKGKVPRVYLEKYYSDKMEEDVLKALVNDTYFKALMDEKIYPVSHPDIESDPLKRGEPFTYSATVEIFPDIEVRDYTGFEIKKEKFMPSEEAVEKRLTEMQESMAQLKPVEDGRAIANGNFVTLDFAGFVDGAPMENGAAEDFVLEIGSAKFIPGFEEQLIGMNRGTEGEIHVTFPENYGAEELKGKEATFQIKIKEIKAKEMPPLDDELAKEFGDFETIEDVRTKIAELYERQERQRIDTDFRERLIRMLIEKNNIEIPETLVDKQLQLMLDNAKSRLASQKLTLEMMGLDEKGYRIQFRAIAESQVKGSLLLEALAKQENIQVGDDDLEKEIESIAAQNNQNVENISKYFKSNEQARENLIAQIRESKTIDFLTSKSNIVEATREELGQENA